jgi:hypothetical protein
MANHSKRSGAGIPARRRRIIVVVVPPVEELDLVGPMQVFGAANRLSGRKVYSLEVATNGGELEVQGEGGLLSFLAQGRLKDVKGPIDSVRRHSNGPRSGAVGMAEEGLPVAPPVGRRVRQFVSAGGSRSPER